MQNKHRFLVYQCQWGAFERNLRRIYSLWLGLDLSVWWIFQYSMYILQSTASTAETTVELVVLQNVYKRKRCNLIPTAPTRLGQSWASQPTDDGQSCLTLQAAFLVDVTAASWMQMRSQQSSKDTRTTQEKYMIEVFQDIPSATSSVLTVAHSGPCWSWTRDAFDAPSTPCMVARSLNSSATQHLWTNPLRSAIQPRAFNFDTIPSSQGWIAQCWY